MLHPVKSSVKHADQGSHLSHHFQGIEDGKRSDQNNGEPGKGKFPADGK